MKTRMRTFGPVALPLTSVAALVGAATFAPGSALASGYATARFGGDHGNVVTDNPTAIYYNPAGLAERAPDEEKPFQVSIFLDVNAAWRLAGWSHEAAALDIEEPPGAEGANTGEASLFNLVAAPMGGVNFKIDSFAIGAAVYFPFGGQAKWDKNDAFENNNQYPGPVDGVQRWHTIDGTIRSMYISVGAAYDILERVSIGAAFNLVRSEITTIRAREVGGTNDIGSEGRSLIDVSGWHGSFSAGILGEVVPRKLWLGFSYQSQPGVAGDMELEGTLKNKFGPNIDESEIKLFQQLPAIYRAGVRARPSEDFELRFVGEIVNWAVLDNQCLVAKEQDGVESTECDVDKTGAATSSPLPIQNIKRDWGPAFALRVGGSYFASKAVELFASVGYDSSAVPDATLEPALMDFHDISPGAGAKFRAGSIFAAAVSYTQFIYLPRDNSGKSKLQEFASPSKTPDGGGQYSQALGALNVNVELVFP